MAVDNPSLNKDSLPEQRMLGIGHNNLPEDSVEKIIINIPYDKTISAISFEEYFGKVGFYCALLEIEENPVGDLVRYYKALEDRKLAIIAEYVKAWSYESDEYKYQIEVEIPNQISEIEKEVKNYSTNIGSLISERDVLNKDLLQTTRKELLLKYSELAKDEVGINLNRINEVKNELSSIVEGYKSLHEKQNQKDLMQEQRSLGDILEKIKKQYDNINHKMSNLNIAGFNSYIFQLLLSMGYALSAVAGWFFSNFVVYLNNRSNGAALQLNSHDYISLFLERIFTTQLESRDRVTYFFILTGILVVFLLLVSIVAWFTNTIFIRTSGIKGLQLRSALDMEKKNVEFQAKIQSPNFFLFWMQVLPVFLVIGFVVVTLVIIGLGPQANNWGNVGASAVALAVGTTIALSSGGISLIYITKIIEPRNESSTPENNRHFIKKNWEISFIIILLIISALGLAFVDPARDPDLIKGLILGEFVSLVLLSGFLIGYGTRYKGLALMEAKLRGDYLMVSMALEEANNPSLLRNSSIEGKKFREGIARITGQLVELVARRNVAAIHVVNRSSKNFGVINQVTVKENIKENDNTPGVQNSPTVESNFYFFGRKMKIPAIKFILNPISQFFKRRNSLIVGSQNIQSLDTIGALEDPTRKYFVQHRESIFLLEEEMRQVSERVRKLNEEIELARQENAPYQLERKEKIKNLKEQRSSLIEKFATSVRDQQRKLDELEDRFERYRYYLRDGFNLGVWFRENGIGPAKDFYQTIKSKPSI